MSTSLEIQHSDASSTRTVPSDDSDLKKSARNEKTETTVTEQGQGGELQKELAAAVEAFAEPPVDTEDENAQFGEHPDGGLRAWLVVLGVSGNRSHTA